MNSSTPKQPPEVRELAACLVKVNNSGLRLPQEDKGWLVIPGWGFDIHLLFNQDGSVRSGYINATDGG